tara:strand:- start:1087 stop:2136 length:1050 start_codon:yes stop_codon:yes gene_type:complete
MKTDNFLDVVLGFIGKHWGEIYTAYDLFGDMKKKANSTKSTESTNNSSAPEPDLKGGFFRTGDEIKMIRELLNIRTSHYDDHIDPTTGNVTQIVTDTGFKDAEEKILVGLLGYMYRDQYRDLTNPAVKLAISNYAAVQSEAWRTMVTELNSAAQKMGTVTERQVSDEFSNSGFTKRVKSGRNNWRDEALLNKTTTTVDYTRDEYSESVGYTRKLFKRLVAIVESEANKASPKARTTTKQRHLENGYKEAIAYMTALGMPMMPTPESLKWWDENLTFSKLMEVAAKGKAWMFDEVDGQPSRFKKASNWTNRKTLGARLKLYVKYKESETYLQKRKSEKRFWMKTWDFLTS